MTTQSKQQQKRRAAAESARRVLSSLLPQTSLAAAALVASRALPQRSEAAATITLHSPPSAAPKSPPDSQPPRARHCRSTLMAAARARILISRAESSFGRLIVHTNRITFKRSSDSRTRARSQLQLKRRDRLRMLAACKTDFVDSSDSVFKDSCFVVSVCHLRRCVQSCCVVMRRAQSVGVAAASDHKDRLRCDGIQNGERRSERTGSWRAEVASLGNAGYERRSRWRGEEDWRVHRCAQMMRPRWRRGKEEKRESAGPLLLPIKRRQTAARSMGMVKRRDGRRDG